MKRRELLGAATAAGGLLTAPRLLAQSGSPFSRPITIVNPFAPGGGTDTFLKPLAAQLQTQLGVEIKIDYKPGKGGTAGAAYASKLPGDGHHFLMGAVHHAIAPSVYQNPGFDIEKDFVPVAFCASVPQIIVVNPTKVPVTDLQSFLNHLRKFSGKLQYGSPGAGTSQHMSGELMRVMLDTQLTHVPYDGAAPAMKDLIAGKIDMIFDGLGGSAARVKAGEVRGIALFANERSPALPDIPTVIESGFVGFDVSTWYALWASKGTSQAVAQRMNTEVRRALATADVKAAWGRAGATVTDMQPDQFEGFLNYELGRWRVVAKRANVQKV